MNTWWLVWLACMFVFVLSPVGYGWGYRGWGPPYPRYLQRRRGQLAAASGTPSSFDHQAWGLGGDLIWIMFVVGLLWIGTSIWWRR